MKGYQNKIEFDIKNVVLVSFLMGCSGPHVHADKICICQNYVVVEVGMRFFPLELTYSAVMQMYLDT